MKLYENDPLQGILELNPWIVGGLVLAIVGVLYLLALRDYFQTEHHGRVGLTYFWTTTFGDPIIMPIVAGLIAAFYQNAEVDGGVLVSKELSWLSVIASLVITSVWLSTGPMKDRRGDWTTTAPLDNLRHGTVEIGVNTYGWFHAIFFWGTAYLWLNFGIKAIGFLAKEGFSGELTTYAVVIGALAALFLLIIGPRDNKSASPLYKILKI
ncbi:MAG TPA: hypothetical protein VIH52_02180 [Candidatus Nanoarchaeia archaeon]|nr:hypothetical protein [uncultured archaeon]